MRLPAITLKQPFASALLSGAKTLESRSSPALSYLAGGLCAVRAGRRSWDPADGQPTLSFSAGSLAADGLVHGVVRLQGTTSRREAADRLGPETVSARVGLI